MKSLTTDRREDSFSGVTHSWLQLKRQIIAMSTRGEELGSSIQDPMEDLIRFISHSQSFEHRFRIL
jgi:hypothetical protein